MTNQPLLRVAHEKMVLPQGDGSPLSVNAPVIHIEGEFIRYGHREQISPRDYRLSHLLRGCLGSEVDATSHQSGSRFAIVEPNSIFRIENPSLKFGSDVIIEAEGLGDAQPVTASSSAVGRALRTLSPVHGSSQFQANGDLDIRWIRRSRYDTGWRDFIDVPRVEERLLFKIEFSSNSVPLGEYLVEDERLVVPEAQIAGWGLQVGSPLLLAIRQIGQFAASDPLILNSLV